MDPTKRRIRKIDRDVQRFVAHALHNTSLSLSDYEMVQTVHHRPGITQGELCRRYSQDKSTVARRAAKLEKKGFTRIGGSAEAEGRPVTEADLEKLGDALLDRLKAESKGGTKKGGKAKEEPDGSGTGEPDSGNGEK